MRLGGWRSSRCQGRDGWKEGRERAVGGVGGWSVEASGDGMDGTGGCDRVRWVCQVPGARYLRDG